MPAFYIVLQEKIPGVDETGVEGHALSKHSDQIDELARQAAVTPLISFFSVPRDEVIGLLEGHEVPNIPDEGWFPAEEGLKTIAALSRVLANSRQQNVELIQELAEFGDVLEAARAKNIRWHLGIDY